MRRSLVVISLLATGLLLVGSVSAQTNFIALIDGNQPVPPTGSPATGLGCMTLDANNTLNWQISYSGLQGAETAAHFHGPAPAGLNAGVQVGVGVGNPKVGSALLTAAQATDLLNGLWYINIHSNLFPGGEIRGQVLTSATPCTLPVDPSTWGAIKALYDAE